MATIRRLYLYAVSLVSLEVVIWGAIGLARSIFAGQEVGGSVSRLAGPLSQVLVGVPVFGLHWWLAQRSALKDPEERTARLRAVFFYGALLGTLVPMVQNALALFNRLFLMLFELSPLQAMFGGSQTWSDNLIAMLVNGVAAAYLFSVLRLDWRLASPGDDWQAVRRLYRYLWLLYGLAMVVFGVQQALKYILGIQAVGSGLQNSLANGLALLLVGIPLWLYVNQRIQLTLDEPGEADSLVRLVVLYLLSLASVVSVLTSGGMVVYVLLRAALGETFTLVTFLARLSDPLSVAVPLGGVWAYYGRMLTREMSALPDLPRRAGLRQRPGLRRVYYYVLALLGLGTTFIGLQNLLSFLLTQAINPSAIGLNVLRTLLAGALAALAVGLPLWLLTWRPMMREAALEGEDGDHARRSQVRKAYLYLALFAGVMGVMFSTGSLLYQLLNAWLGQPSPGLLLQALQMVKLILLFALLLGYHWLALRADARLAERSLSRRHALFPVLVLSPEEGDFAERLVKALEREAPTLPVAIHPVSQGVPDEGLSAAKAVIVPTEVMARPSESIRLWLQGFAGIHLVVTTPVTGWYWIYSSGLSAESLARQTARSVRHLAEEQEIPPPREASPWMTVVYVLAGLFVLEILLVVVTSVANLVSLFH
jgi:hypothetical protein